MPAKFIDSADIIAVENIGVLIYGQPGCLAGDTHIGYQIRNAEGRIQNHKGGSLELLFRRFHSLPRLGKGAYQRPQTSEADFFIQSVDDEGFVFLNKVVDVLNSGRKQTWKVTTKRGKVIKATPCHRFMTPTGYKPLQEIMIGDEVLIHDKKIKSKGREPRVRRREIYVKNHAGGRVKIVNGCTYYVVRKSRAVVESRRNGFATLTQYVHALNTLPAEEAMGLWIVPHSMDVHHVDENPLNDLFDNLRLVTKPGHNELHIEEAKKRIRFSVVSDVVVSIEVVGEEQVYDITVEGAFPNFIASGFGVHNSRKTSIAQTAESPFTLAFDPGIYRCFGRKGCMMFDSWADVVQLDGDRDKFLSGESLPVDPKYLTGVEQYANAKTVILDTAGMGVNLMGTFIGLMDTKHKNRAGGLTLQGYGALKSLFSQWVHLLKSRKQDIVFVCHEDEVRRADDQYFQPSIVGSSYDTVMEKADVAGYMHFENAKRVIDFYPSDRWMAKAPPCGWQQAMTLPDFGKKPDFLAKLIRQAKDSMGKASQASAHIAAEVKTHTDWIDDDPTIDDVNAFIHNKFKDIQDKAVKEQVWDHLKKRMRAAGAEYNGEKKFWWFPQSNPTTQGDTP